MAHKSRWVRDTEEKRRKHRECERARGRAGLTKRTPYRDLSTEQQRRIVERAKAWAKANPDRQRASKRRQYARNKQKWTLWEEQRRARKAKAPGSFTPHDIHMLYSEQDGCCFYCGVAMHHKFHIDHRVPLSRGGTNHMENIALACPGCNLSKHNKTDEEFVAWRKEAA